MKNNCAAVIHGYEHALDISERMLGHAAGMEWQKLIDLEHCYLREIDQLRSLDHQGMLEGEHLAYKKRILARLLDNDRQLHRMLQQKLTELSQLIDQNRTQQQVNRAYGEVSHLARKSL